MRWLQVRFDFRSTVYRLVIIGHQGHSDVTPGCSHADLFIYLGAVHNRWVKGRNVGRRVVIARSNCSRIEVKQPPYQTIMHC